MKAYGLPRALDIEHPDLMDIRVYGLKSSTGQIRSKGGDYRGHNKSKTRNAARAVWKGKARAAAKQNIRKELDING